MQQEQDPAMVNQNPQSNGQTPTPVQDPAINPLDVGAIAAGEIPRSGEWPAVESAHLLAHPACAACGEGQPGQGLQVHHMLPFHFCVKLGRPELELDERNLMTLCDQSINNHHLLLGHLGDFQSYNPNVKADVAGPLGHLGDDQIDADPSWQTAMRQRPPFLSRMTNQQIADFKVLMNTWYPPQPPQPPQTDSGNG